MPFYNSADANSSTKLHQARDLISQAGVQGF